MRTYTAIGTRTGKVRHYTTDIDPFGISYARTLCFKTVRNPVKFPDHAVNCERCADVHDFEAGKSGHDLSIANFGESADWRGAEGTCQCGQWATTVLRGTEGIRGGVGPEIVEQHYEHVRAAYRAQKTA